MDVRLVFLCLLIWWTTYTYIYTDRGCLKKSGQIFWPLQQKPLFQKQKYTLDGQNYASKGLIWDIAHVCGSKTFGDMIKKARKSFFKKLFFCNFFSLIGGRGPGVIWAMPTKMYDIFTWQCPQGKLLKWWFKSWIEEDKVNMCSAR